jgi:glycosyltransferase involved in cell wall biosynthesis
MLENQSSIEGSTPNVFVIIPMLNEQDSIGLVLDDLPAMAQVVVVDNGSTDRGPEIANDKGASVLLEPQKGYGKACLTGIEHVAKEVTDPEHTIVVFIDGDYSDHPDELPLLVEKIVDEEYDFVIGSRATGNREKGAMHFQALFGNWLACTLMRLFWGAKFTDLGPFRAIRFKSLMDLGMQDENFGWTIEMQIKAVQNDLKITEVPVSYRRRIGVSKISGTVSGTFRAGYKILWTIFRYRFLK